MSSSKFKAINCLPRYCELAMMRQRVAKIILITLIGTTLLTLLLLPYLINGLWYDDSLNSQIWGLIKRAHTDWWSFSMCVTKAWLWGNGRILFYWPVLYGFFYLIRDARLVRIADVFLLVMHITSVVYLLRCIKIPWRSIGMFVLLLIPLFQMRDFHDPIAGYATMYQVLGLMITFAMIFLVKWRQTDNVGYLLASTLVVTFSLSFYELNVIYVPIALTMIYLAPNPRRLRNLIIVIVPFLLFALAELYVKHHASGSYPGSEFGSVLVAPLTYIQQLIATLPGSAYLLRLHHHYSFKQLFLDFLTNKTAWMIIILYFISYIFLAKQIKKQSIKTLSRGVIMTAAAFILLPAALIAISARYQAEVTWGNGYLPVYYQYFGLAFLSMVILERFLHKHSQSALIKLGLALAIGAALNWTVNMYRVKCVDTEIAEPRNSLVLAMKSGLLDRVQNGDIIEITDQPVFINGNLIYQIIQKEVYIPNEVAIAGWFTPETRVGAKHYRLLRNNKMWYLETVL